MTRCNSDMLEEYLASCLTALLSHSHWGSFKTEDNSPQTDDSLYSVQVIPEPVRASKLSPMCGSKIGFMHRGAEQPGIPEEQSQMAALEQPLT